MSTIRARIRASLVAVLLAAIASIGIVGCSEQSPAAPEGTSSSASIKRPVGVIYNSQRGKPIYVETE